MLQNRGIKSLVVTGVTAEVCVQTTAREAGIFGWVAHSTDFISVLSSP
jgi:nicotinamidase-related amidase